MQIRFRKYLVEIYLKRKNISEEEFCEKCGISRQEYSRIMEGGDCNLLPIFKIASVLGLRLHQLFEEEK